MTRLFARLGVIGFAAWSHAVTAGGVAHTSTATLTCGQARFVTRTSSLSHIPPEDDFAWTAQTITLQVKPEGREQELSSVQEQPPSANKPELDSVVTSWKCLQGRRQKVVLLWLTCAKADLGGVCHGEREWQRFLDIQGQPLDAGYTPQDKRYAALSAKLGITTDGVQLDDAVGQ